MDQISDEFKVKTEEKQNSLPSENQQESCFEEIKLPKQTSALRNQKACWYYLNYGRCRYGSNCKYGHPKFSYPKFKFGNGDREQNCKFRNRPVRNSASPKHSSKVSPCSLTVENNEINNVNRYSNEYQPISLPLSSESDGAICKKTMPSTSRNFRVFSNKNHNINQDIFESQKNLQMSNVSSEVKEVFSSSKNKAILNPKQPHQLSLLSKEDLQCLRETEISQLKKRYPNLQFEQVEDKDIFSFSFSSSDPDWSFDLKFVTLSVSLPKEYPKVPCEVKVVDAEERMPPILLRFLNRRVKDWLQERHETHISAGKVEVVLRPFFRWLDKNLEQLFIEGLRKVKLDIEATKAGIEFVPYESLPGAAVSSSLPCRKEDNSEEQKENVIMQICTEASHPNQENVDTLSNTQEQSTFDGTKSLSNSSASKACKQSSTVKKGTEVKLLNFELKEGASCLQFQKLVISVHCTRCKTLVEITALSKQKHYAGSCSKCHQMQMAVYQPVLLHPFSSVLGYLHLTGCQIIDLALVQCQFVVDCLNCNKQNVSDGIHYGQTHVTWCLFCNQKLCISVEGVKFYQIQPVVNDKVFCTQENKKKEKDLLIEKGKPLPNTGTCKHYKKSHRWLRFPCCGKAYACDLCHDENETGHEMKYASRMICGFCSKEQPYSKENPCISCSSILTKKSGMHWEGGKGCRDKIKMSREDKQKYSGVSKTTSRKALALQPKKKS